MQPRLLQVSYLFLLQAILPDTSISRCACWYFAVPLLGGVKGRAEEVLPGGWWGCGCGGSPAEGQPCGRPLLGPLQAAFHRDASGLQQLPQLPWFSCLSVSCSASLFWTCACFCVRKVIESQSLACLGKTQETRRRVL